VLSLGLREERKKLDLGKYSLVVFESGGKKYEIIVDPRIVLRYYKGQARPEDAIVLFDVFYDAQKGEKAPVSDLKKLVLRGAIGEMREKLGRSLSKDEVEKLRGEIEDLEEDTLREYAAKYILKVGTLKLPKELRDELLEKKEKRIISYIQKYAINPTTKAPYTPQKIKEALTTLFTGTKVGDKKIRIMLDPLKEIDEELPIIIDALKSIIPIKLEVIVAKIRVPAQYTAVAYGQIEKYGTIKESSWLDDGSLEAIIEVPGGEFMQFHRKMLDITRGSLKLEIIERKTIG